MSALAVVTLVMSAVAEVPIFALLVPMPSRADSLTVLANTDDPEERSLPVLLTIVTSLPPAVIVPPSVKSPMALLRPISPEVAVIVCTVDLPDKAR